MVSTKEVLKQFRDLGVRPSFFARGEIKELGCVLLPGEHLRHVVSGWYENGFALLVATEHRVLLIDKKMFYLKLEDLRYDKIAEVRFMNRLLDSTLTLAYGGSVLTFRSWNQAGLRRLMEHTQETIMKINRFQWAMDPEYSNQPNTAIVNPKPVAATTGSGSGLPYSVDAYPDDLMQRARQELGLQRNPYAQTNKYMRRRVPRAGFNYASRS